MRYKRFLQGRIAFRLFSAFVIPVLVLGYQGIASAACADPNQQTCSSGSLGGYGVSEIQFGTGGALCDVNSPDQSQSEHSSGSTGYCAKVAVGETGVGFTGNTLGGLYQAQAGFNTNREPSLAVLINDTQCSSGHAGTNWSSWDLGTLTTSAVSHVTGNFSVMSYLASNYVVITSGTPPKYTSGGVTHYFNTLSNGSPSAGIESFGMNLAANTGFGYGVSPIPDVTFSFGQAASSAQNGGLRGYNTGDSYSYHDNDEIALSNKSSGVSCYYPSYVYAISRTTPAGTYTFNQSIVVTSTF